MTGAYYSEEDRCWYVPVSGELMKPETLAVEPVRVEMKDGQLWITQLDPASAVRELADALRWALYWIGRQGVVPLAEESESWRPGDPESDECKKWHEARKALKRHHIDVDPSPATRKERL